MKLCIAQTRSFRGDIEKNIAHHIQFVEVAIEQQADLIIFPELSITGYEPALANELATTQDDKRFDRFQLLSDENNIIIGIGAPLRTDAGICISMILFHPHQPRQTYFKKYIHSSEEPFFVGGHNDLYTVRGTSIALAICYELSVPEHAATAAAHKAEYFIASVVEDAAGADRALGKLAATASTYSIPVLMANCIGATAVYEGGGKSSALNKKGELAGQLDDNHEGILIVDTTTGAVKTSLLKTTVAANS